MEKKFFEMEKQGKQLNFAMFVFDKIDIFCHFCLNESLLNEIEKEDQRMRLMFDKEYRILRPIFDEED